MSTHEKDSAHVQSSPHELTGVEASDRLRELVTDIDFTLLTTVDASGHLVSRPMSTRHVDDDGTIWFFTSDDSKKADEVDEESDVNLAYLDNKGMRFVTVAGKARIVDDRDLMERLYTPSLDIWFADGLDTPDIALLRVSPVEAEFWEPAHGKIAMAAGMLKALITRDTPDDTMTHGTVRGSAA